MTSVLQVKDSVYLLTISNSGDYVSLVKPGSDTAQTLAAPDGQGFNWCSRALRSRLAVVGNNLYAVLDSQVYRYLVAPGSFATPVLVMSQADSAWTPVAIVPTSRGDYWWVVEDGADYERRYRLCSSDFGQTLTIVDGGNQGFDFRQSFVSLGYRLVQIGDNQSRCSDCGMYATSYYDAQLVVDPFASRPVDQLWNWTYFWWFARGTAVALGLWLIGGIAPALGKLISCLVKTASSKKDADTGGAEAAG